MRVVFMGTPGFAVPVLEGLLAEDYSVLAVYTQPDRPAGRGRRPAQSAVKQAALARGLPVLQPARLRGEAVVAGLAEFRPDVIVVAAYGQLLPRAVLGLPRLGCVNVHASLLPRYRGAAPVPAAILAGDRFTGVTIMQMEVGMDTGPVLSRAQIPILARDTTGTLTEKLASIGARLLLDVLPRLERGELTPEPQDGARATYCRPLDKQDGEIDWQQPAVEIWRRVRAFQPWPGAFTTWAGKRLKVVAAVPLPGAGGQPGRVVAVPQGQAALGVETGEGVLGLVTVQLEGRRAMSADEFLRGQRHCIGMVLPS